jgi:hypothetical protein
MLSPSDTEQRPGAKRKKKRKKGEKMLAREMIKNAGA